ncbi:MAG: hypothetical protein V8T00_09930 [Oscillospiraceae bacterium]
MVKGINRQVIVVRPPDQKLFEQAIFLLRPDAQDSCNVTQDELLRQAQQAAKGYSTAHLPGGQAAREPCVKARLEPRGRRSCGAGVDAQHPFMIHK